MFDEFEHARHFFEAWNAVSIARHVHYGLFTFGESDLPYVLVTGTDQAGDLVKVRRGEVRITRPTIITPRTAEPELQNFFEDYNEAGLASYLLSRTAAFSHLRLTNNSGPDQIVSDSVEEAVARINRQLDDEEEDRVAILTAPPELGGMAVLRYASERVLASAPDNIQELRERGFLP